MGCAQSTPKVQESGKGPQDLGLVPEPGPQAAKVCLNCPCLAGISSDGLD